MARIVNKGKPNEADTFRERYYIIVGHAVVYISCHEMGGKAGIMPWMMSMQ